MKRLFLALVPAGLDENQELLRLHGKFKRTLSDRDKIVKWVPKENWHVTLVFLGNVSLDKAELAQQLLRDWGPADFNLALHLQGVGTFPENDHARMMWLGVSRDQELLDTQSSIESLYRGAGFNIEEQEYVPHVTLARFRNPMNASELVKLGGRKSFGTYPVQEVVLFESVLQGHFPKYIPLLRRRMRNS